MKRALIALCAVAAGCATSKPPVAQEAAAPTAASAPTAADCGAGAGRFIDLGLEDFDQDREKGWRSVADKPGCELAAAGLIAQYRNNLLRHMETLYWHEAQILATKDQYPRAIELMQQSLESRRDFVDWSDPTDAVDIVYSLATIAFLKGDRAELEKQRAELAVIPPPKNWAEIQEAYKKIPTFAEPPAWPLNLNIVDALITCFGKPYREAYGSTECRPKKG